MNMLQSDVVMDCMNGEMIQCPVDNAGGVTEKESQLSSRLINFPHTGSEWKHALSLFCQISKKMCNVFERKPD